MKCKFLLLIGVVFSAHLIAGESLNIDYKLQAKHGVDLSQFTKGPLKLLNISDARSEFSGKQISDSASLKNPVSQLITDAIAQGFKQGGGTLVDDGAKQTFGGELTELKIETFDKSGGKEIQATVRAKLQLKSATGSQSYWQSGVFGRASVPEKEGVEAAIQQALDKFVVSLFLDDYFLIELID